MSLKKKRTYILALLSAPFHRVSVGTVMHFDWHAVDDDGFVGYVDDDSLNVKYSNRALTL